MKRRELFAVSAYALVLAAGIAGAQDADLNVSIRLDEASQSRETAANLQLPIGQGTRPAAPAEQGARFQAADFARPNRLEALQIDAGALPRDRRVAVVRCQAFIGVDDSLGEYFCVADDNRAYRDVVDAVIMAVPNQRFVAARVDGASVRVLMSFAVYIDCRTGSCVTVTGRNHAYDIEQLGLDYVAPQPILASDAWYDGFDHKLRWIRSRMSRVDYSRGDLNMAYVMAAEVDTRGIAAPACLYWVGAGVRSQGITRNRTSAPLFPPRTIRDIDRAVASLSDVRFVPGMVDGAPATLRAYEYGVVEYQSSTAQDGRDFFGVGGLACN